ncbi:response regulator, partial [Patescibacteria group bacterium]|nr:response regulator [Patescibacteria group bacterium]
MEKTPQLGSPDTGQERIKRRILVADDEEILRNLNKRILTSLGYEVVTVGNGQELLDQLAIESFDAVFTDNNMPTMKGIEALAKIRDNFELRDLPVV